MPEPAPSIETAARPRESAPPTMPRMVMPQPERTLERSDPAPAPQPGGHVLIVSAGVGAGHDGAAAELARRLRARGTDVEVRDYLEAMPDWAGRLLRDGYSPTVQYAPWLFEWLFTSLEHRRWVQRLVTTFCRLAGPAVRTWASDADVVVSTYPLASQTLGQLRHRGRLGAPVVTFLTDPAAHRMWVHPRVDQHLTVTAATAADGAARYPMALRPVGALTEPRFCRAVAVGRRTALRRELGVDGHPVVLLSAGSLGIGQVPDTVDAALHHPSVRVLVLCGRNERLRERLAVRDRVVALGWRSDVPELMAAADVLVHNAGGLSFTEALVAGLPAITYLPIPGHGQANAGVLAAAELAPWPKSPAALAEAIEAVCARPRRRPVFDALPGVPDASSVVLGLLPGATNSDPADTSGPLRVWNGSSGPPSRWSRSKQRTAS